MRQALPVDSRIISKGIHLASKCHCCKEFSAESITHLFLQSDIACKEWRYFGEIFQLPSNFSSIGQALKIWLPNVRALSQSDASRAGMASFSLWEIWIARSEGTPMNARCIFLEVINQVQLLSLIHAPAKPSSKIQQHILGIMGVQTKSVKLK